MVDGCKGCRGKKTDVSSKFFGEAGKNWGATVKSLIRFGLRTTDVRRYRSYVRTY